MVLTATPPNLKINNFEQADANDYSPEDPRKKYETL